MLLQLFTKLNYEMYLEERIQNNLSNTREICCFYFLFLSGVQALSLTQASIRLDVINEENPQRAPAAGEWHLYASVVLK